MTTKKAVTTSKSSAAVAKITVPEVLVEKFNKLGVTNEEASSLLVNFGVPLVEVGEILGKYKAIKVTSAEDVEQQKEARETRLKLKKLRTGVENTRKDMKAEYLRKGDAIQAVANYIRDEIAPAETYLQEQEDFIKVQEEKAAAKRVEERTAEIVKHEGDPSIYSLGDMSADAFESLITGLQDAKAAREERDKLQAELAAKEEADRVAAQQRAEEENARLKKEADEREALMAAERAKADAELKIEREKTAALEAEKQKLEDERIAAEKLEAERIQAEEDERIAKQRAQLLAPDKDKLVAFADGLMVVVNTRLPDVKSTEAQEIVLSIQDALTKFSGTIKERAEKL